MNKLIVNKVRLEYNRDTIESNQSEWIPFVLIYEISWIDEHEYLPMVDHDVYNITSNGRLIKLIPPLQEFLDIEYLEKYVKRAKESGVMIRRTAKKYIRAIELLKNKRIDIFVGDHVEKLVHVPGSPLADDFVDEPAIAHKKYVKGLIEGEG